MFLGQAVENALMGLRLAEAGLTANDLVGVCRSAVVAIDRFVAWLPSRESGRFYGLRRLRLAEFADHLEKGDWPYTSDMAAQGFDCACAISGDRTLQAIYRKCAKLIRLVARDISVRELMDSALRPHTFGNHHKAIALYRQRAVTDGSVEEA